jgi:hypothetical protein
MASSVTAVGSTPTSTISPCLQSIIDKKISGISLNCFQWFVHFLLMTFCCFYPSYKDQYERTHQFSDGTQLIDYTNNRIASVVQERVASIVGGRRLETLEYVALNGRKVIFGGPRSHLYFGREFGTIRVEVYDIDRPGLVQIEEIEARDGGEGIKTWTVDTSAAESLDVRSRLTAPELETVYLTEEAAAGVTIRC